MPEAPMDKDDEDYDVVKVRDPLEPDDPVPAMEAEWARAIDYIDEQIVLVEGIQSKAEGRLDELRRAKCVLEQAIRAAKSVYTQPEKEVAEP